MTDEKKTLTLSFGEDNFEREVLKSGEPVLVDFMANWCPPCRAIAPVVDELAADFDGVVKVGKVDIDENESLTAEYAVASIPTLVVFKGGEDVQRFVGLQSKAKIQEALDAV